MGSPSTPPASATSKVTTSTPGAGGQHLRQIGTDGAILVRPDRFIRVAQYRIVSPTPMPSSLPPLPGCLVVILPRSLAWFT